jgi:hypothetical protein
METRKWKLENGKSRMENRKWKIETRNLKLAAAFGFPVSIFEFGRQRQGACAHLMNKWGYAWRSKCL